MEVCVIESFTSGVQAIMFACSGLNSHVLEQSKPFSSCYVSHLYHLSSVTLITIQFFFFVHPIVISFLPLLYFETVSIHRSFLIRAEI